MFSASQRQRFWWFAFLAVLSYVLWMMNRPHVADRIPRAFTKGYAAADVSGYISNAQGDYVLRFTADELIQYDHSDQVDIAKPRFWTLDNNVIGWRLQAVHGRYDRRDQRVVLDQQVKLENANAAPEHRVQMSTSELVLSPATYEASTEAPVIVHGQAVHIEAVGAVFDLRSNRHRLLSQVQISYLDESGQLRQPVKQLRE